MRSLFQARLVVRVHPESLPEGAGPFGGFLTAEAGFETDEAVGHEVGDLLAHQVFVFTIHCCAIILVFRPGRATRFFPA